MDKKIVVIDLDGTFVSVNTFHKWMKFLLIESLKNLNLIAIIQILRHALLRYLKIIDHSQMKFSILKISEIFISKKQCISFVQSLDSYINKKILKVIHNKDNITILATAAPLLYSQYIKEKYDFDYIIATGATSDGNWKENIREKKKENLISLLKLHQLSEHIDILYTDHYDDLPLMNFSQFTYLVNPSEKTKELISHANIDFQIIQ